MCSAKIQKKWGQGDLGRPLWSAGHGVPPLYKIQCTGPPQAAPNRAALECPRVLPSLVHFLLFLFRVHKNKKKSNSCISPFLSHSCFLSISLQERVCGGTTTLQEHFCGADSPTRMILWHVIAHMDDFCERQPSPTRTTNFSND